MRRAVLFVCFSLLLPGANHLNAQGLQTASLAAQSSAGIPFEVMQAEVDAAAANALTPERASTIVGKWLETNGVRNLAPAQLCWCIDRLRPDSSSPQKLSIVWNGRLTVPRTGDYEFSTTPININRPGRHPVRNEFKVVIDGKQVLNTAVAAKGDNEAAGARRKGFQATPWEWRGQPVRLSADAAHTISVEVAYEAPAEAMFAAPSALLYWKGPGIQRQAVTSRYLAGPAGGLQGKYEWAIGKQKRSKVTTDESLAFAWANVAHATSPYRGVIDAAAEVLFKQAASSSYLASCESGEQGYVFSQHPEAAAVLSEPQSRALALELSNRPKLLDSMQPESVAVLYKHLRYTAEDEAIVLLGEWMLRHADVTPVVTADFFKENRLAYWWMGALLHQNPRDRERLRDGSLETDEGACVLPTAYALTYAYLHQDRVNAFFFDGSRPYISLARDWAERLEQRSAGGSLGNDQRINWLIARGQAAEVYRGSSGSDDPAQIRESYYAGLDGITKAELMTTNPAIESRLLRERAARLVAASRFGELEAALAGARSLASPEEIQRWRDVVLAIRQAREARIASQAKQRRDTYINTIKRRRDYAEKAGNDAEVQRYSKILSRVSDG